MTGTLVKRGIANLRNIKRKLAIPRTVKSLAEQQVAPVFVIGTNRGGTSVLSSLMSQHPDLEGLFLGSLTPDLLESKHIHGFCESTHIWSWLVDPKSDHIAENAAGSLWGHPKNFGQYYRDKPRSDKEALLLVNSIQKYRKTSKIPLIKDVMNILRIRLISTIFPDAKFVLIIREYSDYIKSCYHKWSDGREDKTASIGLHWLTLNNLAIYELERFAAKNYAIFKYKHLFDDKETLQSELRAVLTKLKLPQFEFRFDILDIKYRFLKSEVEGADTDFSLPMEIAKHENSLFYGY